MKNTFKNSKKLFLNAKKIFSPLTPILNDLKYVFCVIQFFKSKEKIFCYLNIMKNTFKNSKKLFHHTKKFFSPLIPILNDFKWVFALKYFLNPRKKFFGT